MKKYKLIFLLTLFAVSTAVLFSGCNNKQNQTEIQTPLEFNKFIKDWLIIGPFPNCEEWLIFSGYVW